MNLQIRTRITQLHVFALILLILIPFFAAAITTTKYQSSTPINNSLQRTIEPIILNPEVDDIQQLDPRIKTIIMYAHYDQMEVRVIFYSQSTQRYANQVVALFKANKVAPVTLVKMTPINLLDQHIVKIYLKGRANESANQ